MNDLVNRYVYDVVRRLPNTDRQEVEAELKANIYDMLSDYPSDDEIKKILQQLGHPAKLADQYRQNPKYLISPSNYDQYILILKLVLPIIFVVLVIIGIMFGTLETIANNKTASLLHIFTNATAKGIRFAISSVFQAFIWITIGFVVYEKSGYQQKMRNEWKVEDLPDLSKQKHYMIPLHEPIVEITMSSIFGIVGILIVSGIIPVVYSFSLKKTDVPDIFNPAFLQLCIPIFIVILIFSINASLTKLVYRRWNIIVCCVSILSSVVGAAGFIYLLTRPNIFTTSFLTYIKSIEWQDVDISNFINNNGIDTILTIIIIIIIISSIGSCIHSVYKTITNNQKGNNYE